MTAFFTMRAKDRGFAAHVRDVLGRFQRGNQAIKRANEQSVQWLTARAVANLGDRANRREKDPRHGRLASLIQDSSVSSANIDGFRWLIDARMESANARVAAYARALDVGTDYWVRRTAVRGLPLAFEGRPPYPSLSVPPIQAGYAPGGFGPVRITKPVPAYHWARDAIEAFRKQGMYARFANAELAKVGLVTRQGRSKSRA